MNSFCLTPQREVVGGSWSSWSSRSNRSPILHLATHTYRLCNAGKELPALVEERQVRCARADTRTRCKRVCVCGCVGWVGIRGIEVQDRFRNGRPHRPGARLTGSFGDGPESSNASVQGKKGSHPHPHTHHEKPTSTHARSKHGALTANGNMRICCPNVRSLFLVLGENNGSFSCCGAPRL